MTFPPRLIRVECPRCHAEFEASYRPSINLDFDTIVVQADVWSVPA